jgi:hypothetical protein
MATLVEDFEDTTYITPISGAWTRVSAEAHGGTWSMQCDTPEPLSAISHTVTIPAGATSVRLWSYGASEDTDNTFAVSIDGVDEYTSFAKNFWEQTPELSLVGASTLEIMVGSGFADLIYYVDDIVFTTDSGDPPPTGPTTTIVEDFEDTTYNIPWTGPWVRHNSSVHGGSWALRSPTSPANGATYTATVTVPPGALQVQFWYRVSSESGWDFFRFNTGATQRINESGLGSWQQSAVYDVSSVSTISFIYTKDSGGASGSDAAWVDDIVFTVPGGFIGWGIPIY